MENKNLKSYEDIFNYLEYLNKEYDKTFSELNSITINVLDLSGKKAKEEHKKDLMGRLIHYVSSYEECDRFLKDATTFRRQDIIRFLVDLFSVLYGKKYVVQCGIRDKKQVESVITYDLIISENDLSRFNGEKNVIKDVDLAALFDNCSDCCLLLDNSVKFTLLDGVDLSPDFEDFPELMVAVRRLVDLKLVNPEMSDQKRLLTVLNDSCLDLNGNSEPQLTGPKLEKIYSENN